MRYCGMVGIDPGLVHTGVVRLGLWPNDQAFKVDTLVVDGVEEDELIKVSQFVDEYSDPVFIEAYRPRSHYQNDARMGKAVNDLKRLIPRAKSLENTGVKKVVKPDLMKLLQVWNFSTVTHHQDLRSAARIGLFGLLKDPITNEVFADFVRDHLEGNDWVRI